MLKGLAHDNVVRLLEAFRHGGRLFLVFELAEQTVLQVRLATYCSNPRIDLKVHQDAGVCRRHERHRRAPGWRGRPGAAGLWTENCAVRGSALACMHARITVPNPRSRRRGGA